MNFLCVCALVFFFAWLKKNSRTHNNNAHARQKMRIWFNQNATIGACLIMMALTHIDIMFVLCSKSFGGSKMFSMPLSEVSEYSIHHYGIPQVFLYFISFVFSSANAPWWILVSIFCSTQWTSVLGESCELYHPVIKK